MSKIYNSEKLNNSAACDVTVLEQVDSTNNYAKRELLAETAKPTPFAVIAEMQTAGRGRHTKSFFSPAGGGIYMSYVFRHRYAEADLLALTSRVAEIITPVLQKHTEETLWIKPINDIFKGPRKIVGILVERVDNPKIRGDYALIIGIGVDCFETELPDELSNIVGRLDPDCNLEQLACELFEVLHEHFN